MEYQQKELEKICNPIITKLFQKADSMLGRMPENFTGEELLHLVELLQGSPLKR